MRKVRDTKRITDFLRCDGAFLVLSMLAGDTEDIKSKERKRL